MLLEYEILDLAEVRKVVEGEPIRLMQEKTHRFSQAEEMQVVEIVHPIATKPRLLGAEKGTEQVTLPLSMFPSFMKNTLRQGKESRMCPRITLFVSVTRLSNQIAISAAGGDKRAEGHTMIP